MVFQPVALGPPPRSPTAATARGPRIIPCEEQGPVKLRLAEVLDSAGRLRLNPEIEHGDFFAVHLKKGALTLRARGYVGYIPLTDRIVVHVRPRVPVSNFSRVVRLSGVPATVLTSIRGYAMADEWNDSLLNVYAAAMIEHVEAIASSGMWREYARREALSSFPHGRVEMHRTLQRLYPRGVRHQAHVTWFERSIDNPANRCLKYAMWLLASRYIDLKASDRESRRLHRRLNAMYAVFDGVELDHSRRFTDDPYVRGLRPLPTLRAFYRDALNVALAVIGQRSVLIEGPTGGVRLPSMVLNMNYVFESYIRNVLDLHARTRGWALDVLDGNTDGRRALFTGGSVPLATPDILLRTADSDIPVVLEVKNIPVDELSPREAINQAVTYGLCYGAKRIVLVHPRASTLQPAGMRHLGDVADISVHQYRYDLGAEDLAAEDARFGEAVANLLAPEVLTGAGASPALAA